MTEQVVAARRHDLRREYLPRGGCRGEDALILPPAFKEAEEMVKVAEIQEIPNGGVKRVLVKRRPIAIFNFGGQFFAIGDTCTHAEASLAEGEIDAEACTVTCPLHGAIFSIKTGQALTLPAVSPVERYQVTVEGDSIMLEV